MTKGFPDLLNPATNPGGCTDMRSLVKCLDSQELKPDTIYYMRWKTTASPKTGPERPRDRYSMSQ